LLFEICYASILFIFFQIFFKVGFVEVKFFPTFAVPNDTLGITKISNGEIAQLVEHRTENPCVGGSSPPFTTTIHYKPLTIKWLGVLCFQGGHSRGQFEIFYFFDFGEYHYI
jgi:hypothetical protein